MVKKKKKKTISLEKETLKNAQNKHAYTLNTLYLLRVLVEFQYHLYEA